MLAHAVYPGWVPTRMGGSAATDDLVLPISEAAREFGYDILMVTDSNGPGALERVTRSGRVDGVVLLDVTHQDPRLPVLRGAQQPGAAVGLPRDTEGLDVFDLDFGEAARMLVDHLYALGHREIILISPPKHVFDRGGAYSWRFRDAALEQAARYGIQIFPYYGESRQPAISHSTNAVLDARPGATALMIHNDATVAALPAILNDRSVRVPEDLSVVSLYSKNFGRAFSLSYTAVETSPDLLGQQAVNHLIRRIQDPGAVGAPITRFIAPQLTNRGSVR